MFLRYHIVAFYTEDSQVAEIVPSNLILLAVIFQADGLAMFLQGPIRAIGVQNSAAIGSIVCYYVIAIPLAVFLAFKMDLGVTGLLIGQGFA